MSTQSLFASLAAPTAPFPTASDLMAVKGARRYSGARFSTKDVTIYCRGLNIGTLRTTFFPGLVPNGPEREVKVTLRTLPDGNAGDQIPGHDMEWLLREHIDVDLGGRTHRLSIIQAGVTFIAKTTITLDPRDIESGINWLVPMMARFEILHVSTDRVTFRWNVAYTPDDMMPRRKWVHESTDSISLPAFQHLVAERLMMPM